MRLSEYIKLKEQGYVMDKSKTPLNTNKYNRSSIVNEWYRGNYLGTTICWRCEHSDFNGKVHKCLKKNEIMETILDMPSSCDVYEIDDYFYNLDKIIFKE